MKTIRLSVSLLMTLLLLYFFNRSLPMGKSSIPPLGKFLDPFHGFWQNSYEKKIGAELNITGLTGNVSIYTDSLDIPHIFASNEGDLYLAQGYVTAFDRLWQMEFQTLAAAGRISEILGKVALDYDRGQRRMGMVFGAENNLKNIEEDSLLHSVASSYTAGVNAYIETLDYEDLPIEYKLLDYEPEPWSNLKMALVQMNFSFTLNSAEKDLQLTNALKIFGKETVDLLYPDREDVSDPIVTNTGKWAFKPITLDSIPLALPDELTQLKAPEERPQGIGSNNWVVSGKKTATGSPIVCNDPHLTLGMPSLWYVVHLNAPTVNTMGGSLAGAPTVILGFNDSIAWGCTNAERDLVDWYSIQFKDKTKNEYLSDGKWVKSRKIIEKINIKGEQAYLDTVTYTHHGPVRFDEAYHSESGYNLFAYRWISHDPAMPVKAFYLLNHARNYNDYSTALNYHLSPAQNFVFGSVSGDIAIRVQGKFAVRRKDEGKFVLDGSKTNNEWKAFIPNEQNVAIKNPETNFLFSANQYPTDSTYPYYVQAVNYEAYRNRRISQVLNESTKITPNDMMVLQNDTFNLQAAESLPFMLTQLDSIILSSDEQRIVELLRKWNFFNSIKSTAAIYYEAWWVNLYSSLWDEMTKSNISMTVPTEFTTIKLMKENPRLSFYDIQDTPEIETIRDVIRKAFRNSLVEIETWKSANSGKSFDWANYKDTYIQHLTRLEPLSFHVRNGGNSGIINASSHRWGPSWRMVVSLEKTGVKAWGIYPGGQSGNPGSSNYSSFIDYWTNGKYIPLKFFAKPELYTNDHTVTTLIPGK